MSIKQMAQMTVDSGVVPIEPAYERAELFDSKRTVLRSSLLLRSLELGVLTFRDYRFAARRLPLLSKTYGSTTPIC